MNKRRVFVALPLSAMLLTSCGQALNWETLVTNGTYEFKMQYHDDFNILQLTDIHWNVNSSTTSSKLYLEKVIKEADAHIKATLGAGKKIDLVELTGDQFMLSNTYHVRTFIEFFEAQAAKYDFKYTIIWGNHDHHGLYNPTWLAKKFNEAKHCLYIEPEDNLYGRSNFVINLNEGNNASGATKWQIFNLDSGASFSESPLAVFRNYDYLRKGQTQWYIKENAKAGNNIPAIAYYHIPQQNNQLLWEEVSENPASHKNKFFKLEGFGDAGKEEYYSDFLETAKAHNLKGAFMGHAHNVDWTVDYDGLVLGLGVKTGPELYYAHIDPAEANNNPDLKKGLESVGITEKFDLIGASLVTIKNNSSFDLEHLYYNEREGADDFVRWVKW